MIASDRATVTLQDRPEPRTRVTRPLRIVVAHNQYQQRGGEDVVFENEVKILTDAGHDVHCVMLTNSDVVSVREKVQALLGTAHNAAGVTAIRRAITAYRPAVVHFHNVFPLISPAAYKVCHDADVAVVQTLHNFRPICLGSLLLRQGLICELCVAGSPLQGVLRRCYRGSVVASAAAGHMVAVHRRRGTWNTDVDRYIALSQFSRDKFISGGFPAERIAVKPNFICDPGPSDGGGPARTGVLYVGRLSAEKGVATLIKACAGLNCAVRIVGAGPELPALQAMAGPNVVFLGALDRSSVLAEMRRACAVVAPSIWFEGFPMILIEAFACGTPVIASRIGSLAEIVDDNLTGRLVTPNDPVSLRASIATLIESPDLVGRLGSQARRMFLQRYTAAANLHMLEAVYADAMTARLSG